MERNEMSTLAGASLLITGAAQGMGKLFAALAAEREAARLILWDVRDDLLSVTAEELRSRFPQTVLVAQAVDVSDTRALLRAADAAGPVDILLNNAGVIVGKPFVEHTTAEMDRTIAVNTTALMYLTRHRGSVGNHEHSVHRRSEEGRLAGRASPPAQFAGS
jgi:short-subunit dehydrogenase